MKLLSDVLHNILRISAVFLKDFRKKICYHNSYHAHSEQAVTFVASAFSLIISTFKAKKGIK